MSQTAAALADRTVLGEYRGRDIIRTSVAIQKTGDGLSEALGIDPVVLEIGDRGYIVLEYVVKRHEHEPIEDTDVLNLKQVLVAQAATLVDDDLVAEHVERQKGRIQRARDSATGQGSVNTELLEHQHNDGAHAAGLVEGCPICDDEAAAEAEEQAEK